MSNTRNILPVTAHELLVFHPEVDVARGDIGDMTVWAAQRSRYGQSVLALHASSVERDRLGDALGIAASANEGARPTRIRIPVATGVEGMLVDRQGSVAEAEALAMAEEGVELFAGFLGLSPEERREYTCLPYANQHAYDHMRTPADIRAAIEPLPVGALFHDIPDEQLLLDAFSIARQIFLTSRQ